MGFFVSLKYSLFLLFSIFLTTKALATQSDEQQIKSILDLLPISEKSQTTIKTQKCNYQEEKWISLLLTHEEFKEDIKYNEACDIQGSFTVKFNEAFPFKLSIQKNSITQIIANMFINIEFKESPYLIIKFLDGKLFANSEMTEFELEQRFQIDPFSSEPIKKSMGTIIRIKKDGKFITKKIAP